MCNWMCHDECAMCCCGYIRIGVQWCTFVVECAVCICKFVGKCAVYGCTFGRECAVFSCGYISVNVLSCSSVDTARRAV